jgi:phage shock protein A
MANDPTDDAATPAGPTRPASAPAVPAVSAPLTGTAVPSITPPADYNDAGVPSLDFVRDKIEGRYGRSLGSTELAQETPEARTLHEQAAKREEAAHDRLEAIRRSLRGDASS